MKITLSLTLMLGALASHAQTPPAGAASAPPPPPPFTFFVTSTGGGQGASYGGLEGADAHCQKLAAAAGSPFKTWRAYLSTQGANAVNARDRIGKGPWTNVRGQVIARDVGHLHGDTLEQAQLGSNLTRNTALTEKGERPKAAGDTPNEHDIVTGSTPDGRAFPDGADKTCRNYTSDAEDGAVQLGHFDRTGGGNASWNSAHASRGCSQPKLVSTGGAGLLYCFAAN
ncbi:hypothetical protein [Pelomonas sp. Root1444]|uniref:hypothetical protein n=1 Tax=Pelomonas sp. Root1444 TaxID=1736464 RepID=UPI000703131F|nr:hypothetical protein [Pelomonas sp. Root1444]KQY81004.1 lectin [Pelomonas sp. Root1444]